MTEETTASGPRAALASLRPQTYGNGTPSRISNPIVEPLWVGIRALAAIDPEGATLVDEVGDEITEMAAVIEALVAGARSDGLVLDGFLTRQPTGRTRATYATSDEMPSMGSLIGLRRNRATDTLKLKESSLDARTFGPDDLVSFVVIDLLWLDGTSLIEIPLLERRRLLESVIEASDVLRLGAFVRPPIETWAGSWRTQGFTGLTYKAANSRYLPGEPNPDWVISGMPRR